MGYNTEKKGMDKSTRHILNLLEKLLVINELNLIVRLNEDQNLIESFFLHRSPKGRTEYINFFLGGKLIIEI